jgi:hypothetical protein
MRLMSSPVPVLLVMLASGSLATAGPVAATTVAPSLRPASATVSPGPSACTIGDTATHDACQVTASEGKLVMTYTSNLANTICTTGTSTGCVYSVDVRAIVTISGPLEGVTVNCPWKRYSLLTWLTSSASLVDFVVVAGFSGSGRPEFAH